MKRLILAATFLPGIAVAQPAPGWPISMPTADAPLLLFDHMGTTEPLSCADIIKLVAIGAAHDGTGKPILTVNCVEHQ